MDKNVLDKEEMTFMTFHINDTSGRVCLFENMKYGQCFLCGEDVYMRINTSSYMSGIDSYAINLRNGKMRCFRQCFIIPCEVIGNIKI